MNPEELSAFAKNEFDIDVSNGTAAYRSLQTAIDKELLSLQEKKGKKSTSRYQLLVAARMSIPGKAVAIRRAAEVDNRSSIAAQQLELARKAAEEAASAKEAEKLTKVAKIASKMGKHKSVAATRASSDFRKGRALPFGGLFVVVGALWASKEAFDVDLPNLDPYLWVTLATFALVGSAFLLLASSLIQWADEQRLNRLYDPELQSEALQGIGSDESDDFRDDEPDFFTQRDYQRMLERVARVRHASVLTLSTVDLRGASVDATDLALQRFVEMGALETDMKRGLLLYRLKTD